MFSVQFNFLPVTSLTTGHHDIYAIYSGDTQYPSNSAYVRQNVVANLTLSSTPSATTQVGQTYSQTNVASGGANPLTYSVSAGALPPGTNLNTSTGLVSGTPTTTGAFNYTIQVIDSTAAPQAVTQVVSSLIAAPTVTVTTTSLPGATFGASYTAPALTASGGTSPYSFTATGLPTGLTLNTTSGVISGTPTQSGSFSVAIIATDATTAGNGGPFVSASKTLTLLVYRQTTTATLSSSLTTGLLGQQITLTATVAPVAAIGTASFLDGTTALGANVPLSAGTATCATSLKTAGTHSITAVFTSTNTNYTGSTSPALAIAITDQTAKTVAAIGAFLGARNNQILSNGPDGGRQIDRLVEAGGGSTNGPGGTDGFAATASGLASGPSRLGDGPDATDLSRLRGAGAGARPIGDAIAANAVGLNLGPQGNGGGPDAPGFGTCGGAGGTGLVSVGSGSAGAGSPGANIAARFGQTGSALAGFSDPCPSGATGGGGTVSMGGMRFNGSADGAMRFGFATSLRDMTRSAAEAEAKKASELGYNLSARAGTPGAARPNPFDIWVEGKYASFSDSRANADLTGHFGLFSIGANYVLSPSLLVGTFVQFDSMQQRSDSKATDVRGTGWMAGPYATLRLSRNVFWQVRGAWGQSSNTVSPFLTYTDSFDSTRWLVSSTLSGRWTSGPWALRPAASVSYMEDAAKSYTDTFGTMIPAVTSRLGQAKAGPDVAYRYQLTRDVLIEPHAGLQVIWNFASDTTADGFGQMNGGPIGPGGIRGRAEIGVRATQSGGIGLDLSGSYDGIGAGGYNAVTGKATVRIPLN